MKSSRSKKLVVECGIAIAIFIAVFYLIFPYFLNAQLRGKIERRTQEVKAFVDRFQTKEMQYLSENVFPERTPDSPAETYNRLSGEIRELVVKMNAELMVSTAGGPCSTEGFRAQQNDYAIEGMHVITAVQRAKKVIFWAAAAPVPMQEDQWPELAERVCDAQALKNFINGKEKDLGYYDAAFYPEYFRPFTYDVSNGLDSGGAILFVNSQELK